MKIQLIIELELPDNTPAQLEAYREDLSQVLFDNYVNYATVCHGRDATQWCAKGKVGSVNEDAGAKRIFQHHDTWHDICRDASWSFKEVK